MDAQPAQEMRPIKVIGIALIVFSIVGAWFFFSPLSSGYFFTFFTNISHPRWMLGFLITNIVFYFLTGLGVVFQKTWGYWLLKFWLYLCFFAFPIGTIISYIYLSYIKRHRIKQYFYRR